MGGRAALTVLALGILMCAGCARTAAQAHQDPYSGRYAASGGGGAVDHVQALVKRFDELHPGVVIQTEDVGSNAGISLAQSRSTDFGFTSRDLTKAEKATLDSLPIGVNGTAVVVNADNPVTALTKEQVRGIFSGEITDWSEVGGPPGRIRVVIREKTASTRGSFDDYFFDGNPNYTDDVTEVHSAAQTTSTVKSLETAIGMVTLEQSTASDRGIRLLSIDGVQASMATLEDGSYPVRRDLFLIFNPDQATLKPAVRAFLDFVRGDEGQRIIDRFYLGNSH